MDNTPEAKLIGTKECWGKVNYIYACVDCGSEFTRMQYNNRINPYCGRCYQKHEKIKEAERKKIRQEKHDQQIREEALQPIQKLLDDWFCDKADEPNWVLSQISICIFEQTKEQE